jgi:uncharacterized protein (DUF1800 family)
MLLAALTLIAATEIRALEAQLHPIADPAIDQRLSAFPLLQLSTAQLLEQYPRPQRLLKQLEKRHDVPPELGADPEKKDFADWLHAHGLHAPRDIAEAMRAQKIIRAVYSANPLAETMTDFWLNHFNVSIDKGAVHYFIVGYERDVIRPRIFGKFRDLLLAVAESPAMLFYLDNFASVADAANRPKTKRAAWPPFVDVASCHEPNPAAASQPALPPKPPRGKSAKRGLNENYARELLELHTLGVDGGYTQADVREVARAFTGWTIFDPNGEKACDQSGAFYFDPQLHDTQAKHILGHDFAAGRGIEDGLDVLDLLAHHPATAHFIAMKLVRHFVNDVPPPALVKKVADTFTRTDGDISEMLRAIFLSTEFAHAEKTKRPLEFVASALRAMGAEVENAAPLAGWLARMGEPLYACQPPTGYADTASAWVSQGA